MNPEVHITQKLFQDVVLHRPSVSLKVFFFTFPQLGLAQLSLMLISPRRMLICTVSSLLPFSVTVPGPCPLGKCEWIYETVLMSWSECRQPFPSENYKKIIHSQRKEKKCESDFVPLSMSLESLAYCISHSWRFKMYIYISKTEKLCIKRWHNFI
jgi:hypothetical protein